MIPQKIEAIARIIEIPEDYPDLVLVRCPFCRDIHQHGVSRAERLLGVPIHRFSHCLDLRRELGLKGLRRKRRQQLEEGLELRERAGGDYYILPPAEVSK